MERFEIQAFREILSLIRLLRYFAEGREVDSIFLFLASFYL